MYCTKCGKEISDSTKFCMYCGAPVGNGASPQPETAATTSYHSDVSPEYQNKLKMFIGKNAEYYLRRFQEISAKNSKASWNWAAFFLSTYWCFYRKMYKHGAIFAGILYLCSMIPGIGTVIGGITISIVCGVLGNSFYKNHLDEKIQAAAEMGINDECFGYYALEKGRTSLASGIIFALFMQIVSLMLQLYFSMMLGSLLGGLFSGLLY